jgi:hypothetical protein
LRDVKSVNETGLMDDILYLPTAELKM